MSIRDVMETSWEDLMAVLDSVEPQKEAGFVDLLDFSEDI